MTEVWIAVISSSSALVGVIVGQLLGRFGRRRDLLVKLRSEYAATLWNRVTVEKSKPRAALTAIPELNLPHPPAELVVVDPRGSAAFGLFVELHTIREIVLLTTGRGQGMSDVFRAIGFRGTISSWSNGSRLWPFWRLMALGAWLHVRSDLMLTAYIQRSKVD